MGRFIQYAMGAGLEAYGDSGLDAHRSEIPSERIGVNIGAGRRASGVLKRFTLRS